MKHGFIVSRGSFFLYRKLRWVLTNRILKFFLEQSKRDKEKYLKFYDDYGLFFREGIVTTPEQEQRVCIGTFKRWKSLMVYFAV